MKTKRSAYYKEIAVGLANWLYFRLPVTLCFLKTASLCFLLLGATKVVKKKQTEKDKEGTGAFTI